MYAAAQVLQLHIIFSGNLKWAYSFSALVAHESLEDTTTWQCMREDLKYMWRESVRLTDCFIKVLKLCAA